MLTIHFSLSSAIQTRYRDCVLLRSADTEWTKDVIFQFGMDSCEIYSTETEMTTIYVENIAHDIHCASFMRFQTVAEQLL